MLPRMLLSPSTFGRSGGRGRTRRARARDRVLTSRPAKRSAVLVVCVVAVAPAYFHIFPLRVAAAAPPSCGGDGRSVAAAVGRVRRVRSSLCALGVAYAYARQGCVGEVRFRSWLSGSSVR